MSDSHSEDGLNVVAIGGGTGLATLLSGLKEFVGSDRKGPYRIKDLSAIGAVTDDGGSSGRLRDELRMLPPGDIRNCMVALSEDSHLLAKLFRHRFGGDGELGGHSFGNLFLAAMTDITGDFSDAVRLSSEILASKGHIYPATTADVRLAATLKDGTVVRGETSIGRIGPNIQRLHLEPGSCEPLPAAVSAIANADIISVGPGSLFTSLLPPLLVNGVSAAIARSSAKKIFIANLMTQPGETDGFSVARHLDTIREHAEKLEFDHVIVNNQPVTREQERIYESEGSLQVIIDESLLVPGAVQKVVYGNLLDIGDKVRHHPGTLASTVLQCAGC